MTTLFRRCLIVAVVLLVSVVRAAGPAAIKSRALTSEIKVDGVITDWATLFPLTDEVTVAAANDEDRLVIAIATSEPSVKQRLLASGVVVYLDPHGKKDKTFGVRIPPAGGRFNGAGRSGGGRSGPPPDAQPPQSSSAPQTVTHLEVLGPGKDETHIVDLPSDSGFEVARGNNQGTLLIEIAIPLRKGDGSALGAPLDPSHGLIGLGIETPDLPSPSGGQRGGGGPAGGGGGGRAGMGGGIGGRGGMGGPRGGGGQGGADQGKSLKAWTTLEMSTALPIEGSRRH